MDVYEVWNAFANYTPPTITHQKKYNFISNVYKNILYQLLLSFSIIILSKIPIINIHLKVISIICIFPMLLLALFTERLLLNCASNLSNFWLNTVFITFGLSISGILLILTAMIPIDTILISMIITIALVVFINIYATLTESNYYPYYSIIVCLLYIFTVTKIVDYYYNIQINEMIKALIGVTLFSCFLVYDTQKLSKTDDYILMKNGAMVATINIYIDICKIFINITSYLSIINITSYISIIYYKKCINYLLNIYQ